LTTTSHPRPAVQFDHDGEWSVAARLEDSRQQGCVAVAEIFHVGDVNVILCADCHVRLLCQVGHRICVIVGYTVMGLRVKPHHSCLPVSPMPEIVLPQAPKASCSMVGTSSSAQQPAPIHIDSRAGHKVILD